MTLAANPGIVVICNPYCGAILAELPETSSARIATIVSRARNAAAGFRASTPHQRRVLLNRLADLLARDSEVMAQTVSTEMGKTITEARREVRR